MERFGWCFIGAGRIAERVLADFPRAQGAYLASVHAGHIESARALALRHGAKAYEAFDDAVLDPAVQAVYIATPHMLHAKQAIDVLRLGKPVLCEKPIAMNLRETQAMIGVSRDAGQYLLEGMWTRFNPVIRQVIDWIAQGRIGRVRMLEAAFATRIKGDQPARLFDPAMGGGALLDIGIYTLALARFIFGAKPDAIDAQATMTDSGVDAQCAMTLRYGNDALARLYTAIRVDAPSDAVIYGEKGRIVIPRFALAERATLTTAEGSECFAPEKVGEGFEHEFIAAMEDIRAKRLENALVSHRVTLDVMEMMDAVRAKIGMRFAQDGV